MKFLPGKNILILAPESVENKQYMSRFNLLCSTVKSHFAFDYHAYFLKNGKSALESYISRIIEEKSVDIILALPYASHFELSLSFLNSLSRRCKILFWFSDDDLYFNAYSKYITQFCDAVVTTDYFSVSEYERYGIPAVHYWTSNSKEDIFPSGESKDIDVCFIGEHNKNDRPEYLKYLADNGVNLVTYGFGSTNGRLDWKDFSKTLSRTKININFTKIDKLNWVNSYDPILSLVRQNKAKPIEICMSGAFCLSEYAPSLKYLYDIGAEIDVFNSKEEMLDKVRFYLKNSDVRERMASRAYKRTVENYSDEVCMPKLVAAIDTALSTPRVKPVSILKSSFFKKSEITSLSFSFLLMLKNLNFAAALKTLPNLLMNGPVFFFSGFCGALKHAFNLLGRK